MFDVFPTTWAWSEQAKIIETRIHKYADLQQPPNPKHTRLQNTQQK